MVHDRKKTRKKGLTASRKDRPALTIDLRDQLDARLRKIQAVSCLLGACREEALLSGAVEDAGGLIGEEVRGIKMLLDRAETLP